MDDLERLKQLKASYCRTVDTTESGGGVITGAGAFMAFLRETLADVVTVHHCHTPEITLASASTATGIWAMEDRLRGPDGSELLGFGNVIDDLLDGVPYAITHGDLVGPLGSRHDRLHRAATKATEAGLRARNR